MSTSARVMFWLGIVCLLPVFIPRYEHNAIPYGEENRVQLGVPSSPWLMGQWSEKKVTTTSGASKSTQLNRSHSFRVEVISWSALLALAGTVLIVQSRRQVRQDSLTTASSTSELEYSR